MYRFKLYHPTFKAALVLNNDPMGWDAERKTIERDPTLHGVFVKYTPDLKFVKDGRALIADLYNSFGIEAEITLTIEAKNLKTREWELQYTGRLDLTTLVIDKDFAQCRVDEIGFYQKIKNRQDIKVSLQAATDQDGNNLAVFPDLNLPMHSKSIRRTFRMVGSETCPIAYNLSPGNYYYVPSFESQNLIIDELKERFTYEAALSSTLPTNAQRFHFLTDEDGILSTNISITFQAFASGLFPVNINVSWFLVYGKPGNYTTVGIGGTVSGVNTVIAEFGVTLQLSNIALPKNSEVYIYCRVNTVGGVADVGLSFAANAIELNNLTSIASSTAKAVAIFETWQRAIRNISGKENSFKSTYYGRTENGYAADGGGSLRAITNGDQIRGLDIAKNPIYVSVKELLATCQAIDGVGMGLEKNGGTNQVVVEPLAYFYRNIKALRLSNVLDIKRSVASAYYYNEVEVGYNSWNNRGQQANNLDEVNSKRSYTLPISQVKKKLLLMSPYIAAGYSIEFVRRSASQKTTDTERDKDNYIIQLRRNASVLEPEKNQGITIANVIDAGTVYNARLSPMQNLLRNGRMIASGLYKADTSALVNISVGEGNNEATTQIGAGDVVNENSIAIAKLGEPLWKPEFYEFVAAPSKEDWANFEKEPYGFVEFSASNKDYVKGWLISAKPDAESNRVQFKLLASAL